MRTEAEFREFYEAELRPVVTGLEAVRRRAARISTMVGLVTVAASAALAAAFMVLGHGALKGLCAATVPLVLGAGLGVFLRLRLSLRLRRRVQEEIVAPAIRFAAEAFDYGAGRKLKQRWLDRSMLVHSRIDRYTGSDLVSGRLGETEFRFSRVHAEAESSDDDGRSYVTLFKGWVFVADFNKRFRGHVAIVEDLHEKVWGRIARKAQRVNPMRRGHLVELEDPEFENRFAVYSDKPVEARYILTSAMMADILGLAQKLGRRIELAFFRTNVLVAVHDPGERLLESGLSGPIGYETARSAFEKVQGMLNIVDDLDLNTRIWSKE